VAGCYRPTGVCPFREPCRIAFDGLRRRCRQKTNECLISEGECPCVSVSSFYLLLPKCSFPLRGSNREAISITFPFQCQLFLRQLLKGLTPSQMPLVSDFHSSVKSSMQIATH
jgi:hypothetical protein